METNKRNQRVMGSYQMWISKTLTDSERKVEEGKKKNWDNF